MVFRTVLNVNNYNELNNIPHIKDVVILCHIINTIRSAQRFLISTKDDMNNPVMLRDRIFCLINCICFTYEGIKTSCGIFKKISSDVSKETHKDIAWLISEIKDKNSVFNKTLDTMRNKIGFHFHIKINDQYLKEAISIYPPVFMESITIKNTDISYIISDNYIAQYFKEDEISSDNIKILLKKISEYNLRLCDVLDKVIGDLIYNYADISQLEND